MTSKWIDRPQAQKSELFFEFKWKTKWVTLAVGLMASLAVVYSSGHGAKGSGGTATIAGRINDAGAESRLYAHESSATSVSPAATDAPAMTSMMGSGCATPSFG